MKKLLVSLLALTLIVVAIIYLMVPSKTSISEILDIRANPSVTKRIIRDSDWNRWWPAEKESKNLTYRLNENVFIITNKLYNSLEIAVSNKYNTLATSLNIIPLSNDSVRLEWTGSTPAAYSPITRVRQFAASRNIQESIDVVLDTLKGFLEKQINTYGLQIIQEKVKDTLLITTKSEVKSYPDMQTVYSMINTLRTYAQKKGLQEMNYPMLHILKQGSNEYTAMVAIPVDHEVPAEKGVTYKRMAPGNILVTEVRGGPVTIQQAFAQYEQYLQDYHRISPALPFESLITDRIKEPDTSKWVTRIYYPVF